MIWCYLSDLMFTCLCKSTLSGSFFVTLWPTVAEDCCLFATKTHIYSLKLNVKTGLQFNSWRLFHCRECNLFIAHAVVVLSCVCVMFKSSKKKNWCLSYLSLWGLMQWIINECVSISFPFPWCINEYRHLCKQPHLLVQSAKYYIVWPPNKPLFSF